MAKGKLSQHFQTTIAGSEKGRAYVVLPFEPADAWGSRPRYDVHGFVAGCKFRGKLEQTAHGYILPIGPSWRRDNGLRPGDDVDVTLAPEESAPREELAPDIAAALAADPEAAAFWDVLARFYRRAYLRWIDATKRSPETRRERIEELVRLMRAGVKQR